MFSRKEFSIGIFAVFGITGMMLVAVNRITFLKYLWKKKVKFLINSTKKEVKVVKTPTEWSAVKDRLLKESKFVGAVGFDCEWTQSQGKRRPIALVQFATHSGYCVLFHLYYMTQIPQSFLDFLEDEAILKVGVSCVQDGKYLMEDYDIQVNGCLDLRHFASNSDELWGSKPPVCSGFGLGSLSSHFLGKKLNKDWKVRSSDWENGKLTNTQIEYASEDALSGLEILFAFCSYLWWPNFGQLLLCYANNVALKCISLAVKEISLKYIDQHFSYSKRDDCSSHSIHGISSKQTSFKQSRNFTRAYSTRKGPLYHNCLLKAPDNQPLCTINPTKALWYVEKGLGTLISEDPVVVMLNFEPSGRPQKEGGDGQFYLEERVNCCVVCGKKESYTKKSVVPREYRRYFPTILKSHQNHDVVLLCTTCHQISNQKDRLLRYVLAEEFNAPIGCETDVNIRTDGNLKLVRSAAGALLKNKALIPLDRMEILESTLKKFYSVDTLTEDMVIDAANLDANVINNLYIPHGVKVFEAYKKIGLIHLEMRWRKHFLESMDPQFMPENWSIYHNQNKLMLKAARIPLNDPRRGDLQISLVGSDGVLNIAYIPPSHRIQNALADLSPSSKESSPDDI